MARPSKLSPEIQERICQLIRAGNTVEVSAEAQGISPTTFYNWMKSNQGFREAVEQARAEAESILVSRIARAAQAGSWRAACWLLERQWPDNWASVAERNRVADDIDRELQDLIQTK